MTYQQDANLKVAALTLMLAQDSSINSFDITSTSKDMYPMSLTQCIQSGVPRSHSSTIPRLLQASQPFPISDTELSTQALICASDTLHPTTTSAWSNTLMTSRHMLFFLTPGVRIMKKSHSKMYTRARAKARQSLDTKSCGSAPPRRQEMD
ncbi:hypothetical protein IG631_18735 [Alternaria alternata]|nr:hypothetical protein IG631_18735 [Alternaria alternata]